MKEFDVTIVGAGIAGLSAAIYLKRSSLTSVVLDKGAPGGKLLNIHEIDNYPGLGPVSGPELAMKSMDHATKLGVIYEYGNVLGITKDGDDYIVSTDMDQYRSKAVIIATGTQTKVLGVPGEKEHTGRGVSYCATCDGNFFRKKPVAVIGFKDQAVEEAIYLAGLASELFFVIPEPLDAEDKHIETLKGFENVHFLDGYNLKSIEGEKLVDTIVIEKDGKEEKLSVNGVFPLYGQRSTSDFLEPLGVQLQNGFVVTNETMASSLPGLFAAGDIRFKKLRQVVTAASDGAEAATSAIQYVNALKKKK